MSIRNFLPGKKKGVGGQPSVHRRSRTKSRGGSGSTFRDFRGTDGVVEDADNRRENQSTDSNQ